VSETEINRCRFRKSFSRHDSDRPSEKATGSVAKGWTLLAMELLEVQINLSRVLGISSEIMPSASRFSAHGRDGAADLSWEMVNVIRIPRRIFNVLGNGD
jgi:hypothetical protein